MNPKALMSLGVVAVVIIAAVVLWGPMLMQEETPNPTPQTEEKYSSPEAGLSFIYPTTYELQERTDGFEGNPITVLVLIPKGIVVPDMSEGPTAISVLVVPNPENLALDEWIRTKSISNWQLSNGGEMGASTVGDESGLGYTYSGLYEETVIAVAREGKVYLFSVGTITAEDQIKKDFFDLLDTVTFI